MSEQSLSLEQRGFEYGVKHLLSPQTGDLLTILAESLDLSAQKVSDLLYLGAVYVEGRRAAENIPVVGKTYIRVHTRPRRFPLADLPWSQRVLFENDFFLVVNKPAGLPCHPSVDNIRENVLSFLAQTFQRSFFLTHRLDVPTSGILIIAKTAAFQSAFNKLLQERGLHKIYRAVCCGEVPALGLHRHHMRPSPRAPKHVQLEEAAGYALCELEVLSTQALVGAAVSNCEVHIRLLTGRTHQIRAQMAALGAPVRGDVLYGGEKIYTEERIDLTACEIHFENPITHEKHFFQI